MKKVEESNQMIPNITVRDARIIFRNFAGAERQFNPQGKRNFGVLLEEDIAKTLYADGWNVKWLAPRDEDERPQAWMPVEINFNAPVGSNIQPPVVVIIKNGVKRTIDEEDLSILDWAEIENVDVTIRPYTGGQKFQWDASGRPGVRGVKGFVKQLFVKVRLDELEERYSDVPEDIQGDYDGGRAL